MWNLLLNFLILRFKFALYIIILWKNCKKLIPYGVYCKNLLILIRFPILIVRFENHFLPSIWLSNRLMVKDCVSKTDFFLLLALTLYSTDLFLLVTYVRTWDNGTQSSVPQGQVTPYENLPKLKMKMREKFIFRKSSKFVIIFFFFFNVWFVIKLFIQTKWINKKGKHFSSTCG